MSTDFDMKMAYHMGYEDALAKRMPEQSKVSVLGMGTCKMDTFGDVRFCDADDDESNYEYGTLAECSECGAIVLMPPEYAHFDRESLFAATNFCPNCGRKVEE